MTNRNRSRQAETEDINPRRLKRGAVKRVHVDRWAIGRDELAPGIVGDTHLGPRIINETHIHPDTYAGLRGSAQLLVMSAPAASIASGGDTVEFASVIGRHGFDGVQAGAGWTHPVSGVYVLTYTHEWDEYTGGGTVQLTIDGVPVPEGLIVSGSSGQRFSASLPYQAAAGSVGAIRVEQLSGAAQSCSATVRVALPDPSAGDIEAGDSIQYDVLLAVGDTSQPSTDVIRDALEGLGHTVTIRQTNDFGTPPGLTDFDLVFVNRPGFDETIAVAFQTWLADAIAAGTPACIDPAVAGTDANEIAPHSLPTVLDLAGDLQNYDGLNQITTATVTEPAHPIITQGRSDGETFDAYASSSGHFALTSAASHVGTALASAPAGSNMAGRVNTVAVEAGTAKLTSGTTGARVVWSTYFYAAVSGSTSTGTEYTASGKAFVQRCIQWAGGNL